MEIPAIYIFTHDSIGVGEDGPTHQPIEQLASLRAMPGLITLRPGDANEVVEAWRVAHAAAPRAGRPGADAPGAADARPHASTRRPPGLRKGAYVLADAAGRRARRDPDRRPAARCRSASAPTSSSPPRASKARVVSMPSWELFDAAAAGVPRQVLPPAVTARVSVEQASDVRLGALRRAARGDDRHAHLRRVGAAEGPAEEVRLHARCASSRWAVSNCSEEVDGRVMQLGMIGLGRMGANIVRRLMRDGHECVVYDVERGCGRAAGRRGRDGRDVAGGLRRQADRAARRLGDGPGRVRRPDGRRARARCWSRATS